ncbi:SusC/RagA family TonB-linked outer membrane protein [uncultured Bacteroides sp.]|uniref:SusC/RagA family TonB-linked outer membrane protein n=3 Tax=uncultured Bacteroides sp. TaxID=162156 RepID=UPI0025D9E628|nr:SusC/RagA family TonB-linked outer membrane protein [uncultured Bacteroides sp.]
MRKSIKLLVACALCSPVVLTAQEQDSLLARKSKTVVEYGRGLSFGLKESTTATATAGEEELSHKKSINNSNMLYGLIPGLQVLQNAGNAWDDAATLRVRGYGTSSSTTPLVLVDGFERSLDQISADEIESVTVLKDAASTALYGIKGANGVILVKTKRGKEGKPEINFSYQFTMGTPRRLPELADGYTYATALNEGLANDGLSARYSAEELEAFRTQSHPDAYPNVDWWNEALRDHSFGNNLTFSAKGGGQFVRYFTQLNYLNDNGILKPTDDNDGYSTQFKYSKLNIRTNLDITVSPTTTVQLNLFGNFSEHNRPGETASTLFKALYQVPSGAFPMKTARDVWGGTTVYSNNPIAMIAGEGYARSQTRNMYADMKLNQDLDGLLKGLSAGFEVGLDNSASYWDSNTRKFAYDQPAMDWATGEITYTNLRNEGALSFSKSVGSTVNHFNFGAYANYARDWGKHRLAATLQYHMDKTNAKGQNNSRAFMDVVAQAHYVYNRRYVLDASLSGSAASILEPGHRWGLFPSVGAAWLLSEETALKSDWLNLLKFRASYGVAGRADYDTDLYLDVYGTGGSYLFGKNPSSISGMKITQLGLAGMTYEKSHKLNAGFDFMAFNKLSVTIDGFYDHRTDILISGNNAVSSIFGLSVPKINNGVVDSYGVETALRWADKVGDFNYQIGGMLTFNRNKIVNQNEEYRPYDYLKRTGNRIGQYFGYEVEGIYQNQGEIDHRNVKQNLSDVRPGDLKYKDQNNDGVIDSYDQVALGYSPMPEIYYSLDLNFEYKGFGIYALFQGTGHQSTLLNTPSLYWPLIDNSTISSEYYNNRWTPDTPNAKYPRLTSEGSANNYTTNSLWVADASYLKLRTLELYYNFSDEMMKKSKFVKSARIFARGHDLFCADKIKIADPENIGTNHPTMTQYTLGVNLSF